VNWLLALPGLAICLQAVAGGLQQYTDGLVADRMPRPRQLAGEDADALARPSRGRLRVPARRRLDELLQRPHQARVMLCRALPPAARRTPVSALVVHMTQHELLTMVAPAPAARQSAAYRALGAAAGSTPVDRGDLARGARTRRVLQIHGPLRVLLDRRRLPPGQPSAPLTRPLTTPPVPGAGSPQELDQSRAVSAPGRAPGPAARRRWGLSGGLGCPLHGAA